MKAKTTTGLTLIVLAALTLVACVPVPATPAGRAPQSAAGIANPASVYCVEQGGTLEIRTRADGSQYGICRFPNGQQGEEWAMFRGECPVGGVKVTGDATADPLPSWNPGPAKNTILKFVADVTDSASPSYVPTAERIAVFDNDGTLWTERPMLPQAAFVFQRIAELAPDHPEWQTTQPYQIVLEKDLETLRSLSAEEVEKLVFATHAGMTEEEFEATAKAFLDTARHPRFNVLYKQAVYQPMLELLALLRANGFKNFSVSGGGAEFMRAFSEETYGIPAENVVGSSVQYEFRQTPDGSVLVRKPELATFDDREMKPVNIQRHIGRRPILAAGNSDGDLQMFQYTGGGKGPFLNLLLVHDDAEREYDYLMGADQVMTAAAQSPWMFVSMKRDFKTMFPFPTAAGPTLDWRIGQIIMAGFRGLDLTDELQMGAITDNYGFETAVRHAIEAGVDILAFANNSTFDPAISGRAIEVIQGLVRDGVVSEARIDQSYERIMRLKARLP